MDDDLEAELMDLATNEAAYMPQAAHSMPPIASVPPFSASTTCVAPSGPSASSSPSLRAQAAMPAALIGLCGHQSRPVPAYAAEELSLPPPAFSSSTVAADVKEAELQPVVPSEEPAGWYDQIEMLLATAEAKYTDWLEALELQGSETEEQLRLAEQQRVQRRSVTVVELTERRRAVVHAKLVQSSQSSQQGNSQVVVAEMMDKLTRVVDESGKKLVALRREAMWTRLVENLPHEERDYVAKGADEMFMEKLKYKRDKIETQEIIEQHLQALFRLQPITRNGQSFGRTMSHSLGLVLREFAEIFHFCFGDAAVKAALSGPTADSAAVLILPLMAADINQFSSIMVQVLHYKYPELSRSWATPVVHRCVIDALFEHLQPTLHALYAAAFEPENEYLSRLTQQLRSSRIDRLGVKPIFRLDGSFASSGLIRDANELQLQTLRNYEPLIVRMNALPSYRSPWVKSELLAEVCRDLDRCVKSYYAAQAGAGHQTPTPRKINLTADDLAALLAFLLVSAPAACSHIATQLALLGSFMVSESAMGEEGFAVATLWTAVSHLCYLR